MESSRHTPCAVRRIFFRSSGRHTECACYRGAGPLAVTGGDRGVKLVIAIIQPTKLNAVREALEKIEVTRLTVCDAQGFGRQRGRTEMYRGHEYTTMLLRKIALEIVVNDDFLERTIEHDHQRRPHRPGRDHRRRQDFHPAGRGGDSDQRRQPRPRRGVNFNDSNCKRPRPALCRRQR